MISLITGGSGFLGEIVLSTLLSKGFKVIELYEKDKTPRIDITKSFDIDTQLSIDTVIHCAGKAHSVPRTDEEKKAFYEVNYEGTVNLCNAIDKLAIKPKAFIFISTVAVYGVDEGVDISENHSLNGSTPYAKSKIEAEAYLQDWAQRNNIVLGVLRLPLVAGPNPPGNLGAMINGIKSGRYLSIGNADAKKSMMWAGDIAQIIPKLVDVGGVYNLTDGYHPSFGELEKAMSKSIGKSNPIKIPMFVAKVMAGVGNLLGAKAPINSNKLNRITSTLTFDDTKARERLGWNPTKVLDKIAEIV